MMTDSDVLVVGTGPMGATTTLALARYGVRVRAISKRNWLADGPRAHITNVRAMEALRSLGVEDEVKKQATPWHLMGDMLFATSFAGPEIARIRAWGTGEDRAGDYTSGSPCTMLDVPQIYMEPVLINAAAAAGAQVSFNTEYLRHEQDDDGVDVWLLDRITGHEYRQRVKYLVGADGARSQVAADAGLPFEGVLGRAGHVYAVFTADLSRYVAHRPSILYYIADPVGAFGEIGFGLLRAVRPWNEWIAGWGFDAAAGPPDLSAENALSRIRALVGDPELNVELRSVTPWYVNEQYATTYSAGRVFCGGDAVHRHPPSSGLGSNTSMQDAFNLAWKLAHVVHGWAGHGLLESYSQERVGVGMQVVARANQSRRDYAHLHRALFRDDDANRALAALRRVQDPGEDGVSTRAAVAAALAIKDYEFSAQGTEMNQRYESVAVVPEPDAEPETWRRDPHLYLQATTRPGAKLPHAWLVDRTGHRLSTLDLVRGAQYCVITGLSGTAWVQAIDAMSLPGVRAVVIGEPQHADLYYAWAKVREIDEAGALLVRPDGVVAWRHAAAVADPVEARHLLETALSSLDVAMHAGLTASL
jgi:2,4-dichlorophenol 6-monooxygenase